MSTGEPSSEVRDAKAPGNLVSEQESSLAREAQNEYIKGDFVACANLLEKLELLRPQDLKVTHNKIVLDYCKSTETTRIEVLRKSLNAIGVQGAVATKTADSEDVDRSVLRYNQAVILYHMGQYQAALEIVNSLFAIIEPMGKSTD